MAKGIVPSHDKTMLIIVRHCACPLPVARPNNAPQATCVVETGTPNLEALITSNEVTKLVVNPSSGLMGVIFCDIVLATRLAVRMPPNNIAIATNRDADVPDKCASNNKAAIFGVSFRPRAKQTAAPLKICNALMPCETEPFTSVV